MERLTEKQTAGYDLITMNGEWCDSYCKKQSIQACNECGIYQAIQKLAEYENLEEQGLLVRLPCKVGDTVFVDSKTIPTKNMEFEEVKEVPLFFEGKVVSFRQNGNGNYIKLKIKAKWLHEWVDPDCGPDCAYFETEKYFTYPLSSIGKTVFLTKAEAEQKLKEMESESNENSKENR